MAAGAHEQGQHARMDSHLNACTSQPCDRAQLALDLERMSRVGDDEAVAAADRATAGQDLARPVGDVLACHLHEAEWRDLYDIRLRPVALELGPQCFFDRRAVLGIRHVDEVDDDDPADVAKPKLTDDFFHGFEVVLHDRVLEATLGTLSARPHEAAGVYIDDGEASA